MTNDPYCVLRHSCFVLISSFDIGASSFLHDTMRLDIGLRTVPVHNTRYKMIVSRRAGPTLTMDNFAPVNSEIYLTYFLAAKGSCENFARRVNRRIPTGYFFVDRFAISQLDRVAGRNTQRVSRAADKQHKLESGRHDPVHPDW